MLKKAAYSLGILGTLVVLALRVFDAEPMLAFGISALAILGLAFTLGHATEQLGIAAGPRIGGILNARPYSMPLCTILTKCPAPLGPQCR